MTPHNLSRGATMIDIVKLLICVDPVPGLPKVRATSTDGLILHGASR
jgi:hypothetical protein